MRVYNTKTVVTEVLLVLERNKTPISLLDEVFECIREAVLQQPVTAGGTIGLSLPEYEERGKLLLQELEKHRGLFPDEFSS